MRFVFLLVVLSLAACARDQGPPPLLQAPTGAQIEQVFVATQHGDLASLRNFGNPRQDRTRYFTADVSIPPSHVPGQIEMARNLDPKKHFTVSQVNELAQPGFLDSVAAAPNQEPLVGIFVHGYNTNLMQAGLRAAQIQADFDVPFPLVAFAWPSSGELSGYVYDRDSVLFARDGLERLIRDLHARTGRQVALVAHSMGTLLTMETLRQIALRDPNAVGRMVESVALISPDIDPDVFRRQVSAIDSIPQPFVVFAAKQDRALRLSSLITGTTARLGTLTNAEELAAMGITFVDVGPLHQGQGLAHNIPFNSPEAMLALIAQLENGQPRRR